MEASGGRPVRQRVPGPGVKDLVLRAASDPAFAEQLVQEPEAVAGAYNLTFQQVENIRSLAGQGLLDSVRAARPQAEGGGYY